ncbi:MAG: mechanosensitive ion channel family protein [Lentisphaeria bacterium]
MATEAVTDSGALETITYTLIGAWHGFLRQLPMLAGGVIILVFTYIAGRIFKKFANRILGRFQMRESLQQLMTRLALIGIWITGILLAAMVIFPGMTAGNALAGLGLGSVAIGFAFKDIFENFFAGILILWRFPFENGDFIECNGLMGKVVDVTIRDTYIRKVSGEIVVIPNAMLFKNPVDVLTHPKKRRVQIVAGVAYGENVDAARQVILDAVRSCPSVDKSCDIDVLASEFASSSINYDVLWWTDPKPLESRRSIDEVVAAIKRDLDKAGIEIPFPYRTLTFKEPLHTVAGD